MDNDYLGIITPGEPVVTYYGLEIIELDSEHKKALIEGLKTAL